MLSALPPQNDSKEEKERFRRQQHDKRKDPRKFGQFKDVPALIPKADLGMTIAGMLHRKEKLGKDGKPDVKRLQELTGVNVTAEERDAAWAAITAKPAA